MIFGGRNKAPFPSQKSLYFPPIFTKNSPTSKEKQNKQAKLNVFCTKQDFFNNILLKFAYTLQYKIFYSTCRVLFLKVNQYSPISSKHCKIPFYGHMAPVPNKVIRALIYLNKNLTTVGL